jgi:hypothetical protein
MPRAPLFQSRWAQQTAVTVAMAGVFAVAALLAAATTARSTVALQGATIDLPATWQTLSRARLAPGNIDVRVFGVGAEARQRLMVATLPFEQPEQPQLALQRARQIASQQNLMPADPPANWRPAELNRQGLLAARFFANRTLMIQRGQQRVPIEQWHWVSVLSPDQGRTYWVLYLADETIGHSELQQMQQADRQLLSEIEQSLTLTASN